MPMSMLWHLRQQHDPAHAWLREQLLGTVAEVLADWGAQAARLCGYSALKRKASTRAGGMFRQTTRACSRA